MTGPRFVIVLPSGNRAHAVLVSQEDRVAVAFTFRTQPSLEDQQYAETAVLKSLHELGLVDDAEVGEVRGVYNSVEAGVADMLSYIHTGKAKGPVLRPRKSDKPD